MVISTASLNLRKYDGMGGLIPFEEARIVDEILDQEIFGVGRERRGFLDLVERSYRGAEDMEDGEGELPLLHRVEKADVAQRAQRGREQAGAHVDHGDAGVGARERIEDPHLVGHRRGIDDVGDVGMKPLQRALGRFGIEGPCRHMVGGEIIEQRARYCSLADAALVRSYDDHRWLGHGRSLSAPAPPGAALCSASLIHRIGTARASESRRFSPVSGFTQAGSCLEDLNVC